MSTGAMHAEGCRSSIGLIGMWSRLNVSSTKRFGDHGPRGAAQGNRWIIGQGFGYGNRSAPDTSWTGPISFRPASPSKNLDAGDAADWIHSQSALNGLHSTDIRPWHIAIVYDQFDEDGDNVHSGIVEEYWVAAKKYRISYRSDTLNQTDYAT